VLDVHFTHSSASVMGVLDMVRKKRVLCGVGQTGER
jgi:hypothetical protein